MLPAGKILPNEEIVKLIAHYKKTGSQKSKDKIVLGNIRSVYNIAHKYSKFCKHGSFTFDDLVSDGVLGLIEAIDKFDPNRHVSFSSYSHWWIFKYINKNISFGTLNLPVHRLALFQKYERLMQECSNNGIELSMDEICERLHATRKTLLDTISKKESLYLEYLPTTIVSVDRMKNAIENKNNLEEEICERITVDRIKSIIADKLNDREATAISEGFGLYDQESKTLERVAEIMDISHEHVRTLQNRGLEKIKSILKIGILDGE